MEDVETVVLFRPVGRKELALIEQNGYREFPPRLPWQPIFYPVLNEEYATMIANKWNANDPSSGYRGYVTRFRVRAAYLDRYDKHVAGGKVCKEYWIPAEDLEEFNQNIVGLIEVVAESQGPLDG